MNQIKNGTAYATRLRNIADILVQRLTAEFKDEIHAVVLYGSVARGEATTESDVDVLVLANSALEARIDIHNLSSDIDLDNGVFPQLVLMSTKEFEDQVNMRSWFSMNLVREGVVLYDDGAFGGIRQRVAQTLTGIPR